MSKKKVLDSLKNKFGFDSHRKVYFFIIAAIIVLTLFGVWFFGTPTGHLAQESFFKSFNHVSQERVVEVYAGPEKVKEYTGYYRIEPYQGYIVLINDETGERVDIYNSAVIINEAKGE